jgi:hypothetical protein
VGGEPLRDLERLGGRTGLPATLLPFARGGFAVYAVVLSQRSTAAPRHSTLARAPHFCGWKGRAALAACPAIKK